MVDIGKHQVTRFRPCADKIMDFQTNDTNTRVCSLAAVISPNAVAIVIGANRISGTGALKLYPSSGSQAYSMTALADIFIYPFAEGTQDLKFKEGANNDDWDIYSYGEFLEGPPSD